VHQLLELLRKQKELVSSKMGQVSKLLDSLDGKIPHSFGQSVRNGSNHPDRVELKEQIEKTVGLLFRPQQSIHDLILAQHELMMIGSVALMSEVSFDINGLADLLFRDLRIVREWMVQTEYRFAFPHLEFAPFESQGTPDVYWTIRRPLFRTLIDQTLTIEEVIRSRWPIGKPSEAMIQKAHEEAAAGKAVSRERLLAEMK